MITKLLICLAFELPLVVGACQDEVKKEQTLITSILKQDQFFTSNEETETDKEEGKDQLASTDEDKDLNKFPLLNKEIEESIV